MFLAMGAVAFCEELVRRRVQKQKEALLATGLTRGALWGSTLLAHLGVMLLQLITFCITAQVGQS